MNRRGLRWGAVVLALVAAMALAVWTTRDGEEWPDPLDPRNPGPDGAQAVARVLERSGVTVQIVRSAAALEDVDVDARTTVVVTGTAALSPTTSARLRRHAAAGRLVLVEPPYRVAQDVDDALTTVPVGADRLPADCRGTTMFDGLVLDVDRATAYADRPGHSSARASCFGTEDGAVLWDAGSRGPVLFGAGTALSNEAVTRGDNAAVALRLLGQDARLVWYVPDPADASDGEPVTLSDLLPAWIPPGLLLVGLATVTLLLWRVRRLGPLAREPLPVVVRGVETARSRGRLYRRSGDRGHAARALRRAARDELGDRATPADLAGLLAEDGPDPADDHELVRLAQDLDTLRREARRG